MLFNPGCVTQDSVTMFPENTHRYGLLDSADWAALVPHPHGITTEEDGRPVTISMFHQLECLNIVREQLVSRSPSRNNETLRTGMCLDTPRRRWEVSQHCMNYLRQMVLCHSHTALESIRSEHGPGIVDLTKSRYVCRDWTAVYDRWRRRRDGKT